MKSKLSAALGFHPVAWGILIGTFLSRAGFFMVIPFLGIYLGKVKGIDPGTIGAILGVSFLVGTASSFFGGALSDRVGRYPVMVVSMVLWSLTFVGFAFARSTWVFFLLSALNGLFRNVFEPSARALLTDVVPAERRSDVFGARYFAINVGGAAGPILGLKLGAGASSSLVPFLIGAGIFAAYALGIVAMMLKYKEKPHETAEAGVAAVSFRQMAQIVFTDKVFLCFLLGNLFAAGAYSHLDSTLSQYIGHDRVDFYSFLFFVNSLSVLVFQYPLGRLMKRVTALQSLKIGCLLFGLGLFGFGIFEHIALLAASMAVFTIGEILCFVVGDVLIGEIAPERLRGAYYGASGFAFIGQSVMSWVGGYLLHLLGFGQGPLLFGILMLLAFAAYPFYQAGQSLLKRRVEIRGETVGF
ncbi:MDR family MFS transporter [Cohnella caldifontis]|uniref:MDR family MFS transporter n=1 Tax=Cohnella caldifontis TaxID=3027471 RepID=UPI0023ED5307|nr:MFS transporter [Cohnella sp. YIM B05605]